MIWRALNRAKERCTIRKRFQEKKISAETFNKVIQFQDERRKAFSEGRLEIFKDDELEQDEEKSEITKQDIGQELKLDIEEISVAVGTLREKITPKVSRKCFSILTS